MGVLLRLKKGFLNENVFLLMVIDIEEFLFRWYLWEIKSVFCVIVFF